MKKQKIKNKIIVSLLAISIIGTISSFCLGATEVAHAAESENYHEVVVGNINLHDSANRSLKVSSHHYCIFEGGEANDNSIRNDVRAHSLIFIIPSLTYEFDDISFQNNPDYHLVLLPPPEGAAIASIVKRE